MAVSRGAQGAAIVEERARVPFAIPGVGLDARAQSAGFGQAGFGVGGVAAVPGQPGEGAQHVMQEEGEPDAFALAFAADAVHAVVPVAAFHQGQPAGAVAHGTVQRADAVFPERGVPFGHARQAVVVRFARSERRRVEEGGGLVQHAGVARHGDIAADGIGQPQVVVRDAGAHAAARGGMPPVLHVAFRKLTAGASQQMLARERGALVKERQGILQLVPESERAARLIEPRPSPYPAGQGLVGQPVIDQQVDGRVGRFDVHAAQLTLPEVPDRFQHVAGGGDAAVLQ